MSDGNGLNPLLQHPAMLIHPVMLYTGLVGFAVPYAFAFGALVSGELGTTWFKTTRRSTLFAWTFLSIGIILGGRWAYEVLGWGGYWAWDPVENASFMPWLTGTAFLHSVMIQEKRNMLKVWNLILIGLTYSLCLFGTFLTRSGVVQSVHAFAQTRSSRRFSSATSSSPPPPSWRSCSPGASRSAERTASSRWCPGRRASCSTTGS